MHPSASRYSRRGALGAVAGLLLVAAAGAAPSVPTTPATPKVDRQELVELLKELDERQSTHSDFRSDVYIEQKEKGKVDTAYNAVIFRRSTDRRFLILFTGPKASQGQGYLRIDDNLWFYDPAIGKWERKTERERIGGTNTRRSDYDESRLATEYDPEDSGEQALGPRETRVLTLRGKPGIDLAFPVLKLWVDKATRNVLKRQEFALSGRLLRTTYYPKWKKVWSDAKQADVWYSEEIRSFDEVEKQNSSLILFKDVDLRPLEPNVFTKAWLESKSR